MTDPVLAGHRILVVEDEYFLADEFNRTLRAAGAEVLGPVPSVEAALALLDRGEAPDAVMLDVNLGDELAFPIADALVAAGVPFLFMTGYDEATLPERYADVRRLRKPVETPAMLSEVGHLLRGRNGA